MEAVMDRPGFLKSPAKKQKEKYLLLFIVSFGIMMLSFLPRMILNGGIFTYYGDFNSQQIMFYQHAHDSQALWGHTLSIFWVRRFSGLLPFSRPLLYRI